MRSVIRKRYSCAFDPLCLLHRTHCPKQLFSSNRKNGYRDFSQKCPASYLLFSSDVPHEIHPFFTSRILINLLKYFCNLFFHSVGVVNSNRFAFVSFLSCICFIFFSFWLLTLACFNAHCHPHTICFSFSG